MGLTVFNQFPQLTRLLARMARVAATGQVCGAAGVRALPAGGLSQRPHGGWWGRLQLLAGIHRGRRGRVGLQCRCCSLLPRHGRRAVNSDACHSTRRGSAVPSETRRVASDRKRTLTPFGRRSSCEVVKGERRSSP